MPQDYEAVARRVRGDATFLENPKSLDAVIELVESSNKELLDPDRVHEACSKHPQDRKQFLTNVAGFCALLRVLVRCELRVLWMSNRCLPSGARMHTALPNSQGWAQSNEPPCGPASPTSPLLRFVGKLSCGVARCAEPPLAAQARICAPTSCLQAARGGTIRSKVAKQGPSMMSCTERHLTVFPVPPRTSSTFRAEQEMALHRPRPICPVPGTLSACCIFVVRTDCGSHCRAVVRDLLPRAHHGMGTSPAIHPSGDEHSHPSLSCGRHGTCFFLSCVGSHNADCGSSLHVCSVFIVDARCSGEWNTSLSVLPSTATIKTPPPPPPPTKN